MIKTVEELRDQATKINLRFYPVHECSMCGYPCGYKIFGNEVLLDTGCYCVTYNNTEPSSWDQLAATYNMNQPENNPKISKEFLQELNRVWKFE
jgi:hypothetical protein